MRISDRQLIDKIQAIRTRNNGNWMDLLRLAFKLDPKEARRIFRSIVECDGKIQRLSKQLAGEKR